MTLGEIAYNAYKDSRGGITWNGDRMKDFFEMPEDIQESWNVCGLAVEAYLKPQKKELTEKQKQERKEEIKIKKEKKLNEEKELLVLKNKAKLYDDMNERIDIIKRHESSKK
jgi:hypothetical protein